jgi:hypothetical protein
MPRSVRPCARPLWVWTTSLVLLLRWLALNRKRGKQVAIKVIKAIPRYR